MPMHLSSIEEAIAIAQARWPGLEFRAKSSDEACGPCPICGRATEDGFIIGISGHFFCRPSGCSGWLDDDKPFKPDPEEVRLRRIEAEQARARRKEREHERRLSALEQMHRCTDHLMYHQQMDLDDWDYWRAQGMWDETIERHKLGVCYRCPTDREGRPSYTIPVVNGGQLVNIRHRLIGANGDKYRPHLAGLGNTLFFADHIYEDAERILIVEGEKKAIVVGQYGFLCVGIMGMCAFPPAWATRFEQFAEVDVMLDPDANGRAESIARLFDGRGRVVSLPVKADDFFIIGGTAEQMREFVRLGKPIGRRENGR